MNVDAAKKIVDEWLKEYSLNVDVSLRWELDAWIDWADDQMQDKVSAGEKRYFKRLIDAMRIMRETAR